MFLCQKALSDVLTVKRLKKTGRWEKIPLPLMVA
jgi:hypothetical protein